VVSTLSKKDILGSLCNLVAGSVWSAEMLEAVPCNCTGLALYGGGFGLVQRHEVTPYRGCIAAKNHMNKKYFGPFLAVTTKSCHGNFILSLLPAVHSTTVLIPARTCSYLPCIYITLVTLY